MGVSSTTHTKPSTCVENRTRGSRLRTNGAGLARRSLFTEMPSASTPVHGLHRIRPSHSHRRFAFDDDEVLERRFHRVRSMLRTSFIRAPRDETTFGVGPAQRFLGAERASRRRTLRGWHLPPPNNRCILTGSRIPRLAELHVESAPQVAHPAKDGFEPSVAGGDSSCDVHRPGSACG